MRMKTSEEIKKGLKCCIDGECNSKRITCPYRKESDCATATLMDALAYIQKLEAEKYQLATEAQQLREERDRYWEYIKGLGCDSCGGDCDRCEVTLDRVWTGWEWAGEKEKKIDHE